MWKSKSKSVLPDILKSKLLNFPRSFFYEKGIQTAKFRKGFTKKKQEADLKFKLRSEKLV